MPGAPASRWRGHAATLAPLLALHLSLLAVFDLVHHVALALLLLGAAFLYLPTAARRLEAAGAAAGSGDATAGRGAPEGPKRAILLGALLLRLCLLPLPLTLSDDVLRYLWDGKVAAAGRNPYALPPQAAELAPLRDGNWQRLPHRDVPTVYPPLAIAAFSIAARLPFPILAWKTLAAAADLAACALLLRLARRRGLPAGRTVWYAWNPLVTLEVAGMGHVDALGVAASLAAVLLLLPREDAESAQPSSGARGKILGAAAAAAAGVLAKLAPLAALPLWSRRSGRPFLFLAAALALAGAAFLPVFHATGGPPPGLAAFAVRWEFNGPLFEPLWRLLDAAGLAPALARRLDAYKRWSGEYYGWNWIYPYLYPQLLAKLLLAGGALAAVALSLRERDAAAGTGRLLGRLLLLSATVYPWYLLWVLPWAALARHPAWIALSALLCLSYLPKALGIPLVPWVWLAIWVPFFVLLLATRRRHPWSIA